MRLWAVDKWRNVITETCIPLAKKPLLALESLMPEVYQAASNGQAEFCVDQEFLNAALADKGDGERLVKLDAPVVENQVPVITHSFRGIHIRLIG